MTKTNKYGPWAVITGASDGIGRAIAESAATEGLNVVLAARSEAKLRQLAEGLEQSHGIHSRVVAVDLSRSGGPEALLDATQSLDVGLAVLAAGFGTIGELSDSPVSDELEMIALNVTAVLQLEPSGRTR